MSDDRVRYEKFDAEFQRKCDRYWKAKKELEEARDDFLKIQEMQDIEA